MRFPFVYLVVLAIATSAFSQQPTGANSASSPTIVPRLIRFNGQVKNATGTIGITFALHKSEQEDAALWIESQNVQLDSSGKYTVLLGATKSEGIPTELFTSGEAQWLSIHIAGHPEQPRVLLVSVPYALKAAEADTLAGRSASDFVTNAQLTNTVAQQIQQARFNTSNYKSRAANGIVIDPATSFTDSTSSQVVSVTQNGSGTALVATAKSNTAITGTSNASTGATIGVLGQSASTSGIGIRGFTSATTGSTVALFGSAASNAGIAVAATESATTGSTLGLEATVNSPAGIAALLQNKAAGQIISGRSGSSDTEVFSVSGAGTIQGTGDGLPVIAGDMSCGAKTAGISFEPASPCTNYAFLGYAGETWINRKNNAAVRFLEGNVQEMVLQRGGGLFIEAPTAAPNSGIDSSGYSDTSTANVGGDGGDFYGGRSANSSAGLGVVAEGGESDKSGGTGGDGVYARPGIGATDGYAGNFQGNLHVTGKITAGTKDFEIDHPLDPANKYLYHASIESSEMLNLYTGNVTTNGMGDAVISLPDWFEAVNADFRYQLTVIGEFAQAIVAHKIENHQFAIKTDKPNVEVSWQVVGVRHDAFANANPLNVEVEKPENERGFYLHPELFGAPLEKQIDWGRTPALMQKLRAHGKTESASR